MTIQEKVLRIKELGGQVVVFKSTTISDYRTVVIYPSWDEEKVNFYLDDMIKFLETKPWLVYI